MTLIAPAVLYIVEISPEEYEVNKMWLKHSSDPWTKVLKGVTHADRQQEIRKNVDKSVAHHYSNAHIYIYIYNLLTDPQLNRRDRRRR